MKPVTDITHENAPTAVAMPEQGKHMEAVEAPKTEDQPGTKQAQPQKPMFKQLGSDIRTAFQNFGARWRKSAIEKTPAAIVNRSSNVIGFMHLTAEALMFQSSGTDLLKKEQIKKPSDYILKPIENIKKGVLGNLEKSKFSIGGNPLKAEYYKELPGKIRKSLHDLNDLEAATKRDSIGIDKLPVKMSNKWTARSGICGIAAMSIAAILPDKKDTPEETIAMTTLAKEHPIRYVGKRIYQALNPIEWWNHKRQFSGLGMAITGMLSFVSGFRQVAGKEAGAQSYMRNPWQMAGGIITMVGGSRLLLDIDNDSAWRNFGLTQMLRLATLPPSIAARFKGKEGKMEQGAEWYFGAQGIFQTKNVVAASIGGAEKRPDGTIVDHSDIREKAKLQAKHDIEKHKQEKALRKKGIKVDKNAPDEQLFVDNDPFEVPVNNIRQVGAVERVAPEPHPDIAPVSAAHK